MDATLSLSMLGSVGSGMRHGTLETLDVAWMRLETFAGVNTWREICSEQSHEMRLFFVFVSFNLLNV